MCLRGSSQYFIHSDTARGAPEGVVGINRRGVSHATHFSPYHLGVCTNKWTSMLHCSYHVRRPTNLPANNSASCSTRFCPRPLWLQSTSVVARILAFASYHVVGTADAAAWHSDEERNIAAGSVPRVAAGVGATRWAAASVSATLWGTPLMLGLAVFLPRANPRAPSPTALPVPPTSRDAAHAG